MDYDVTFDPVPIPILVPSATGLECDINRSQSAAYISFVVSEDWGLLPLTGWSITHFLEKEVFYSTPSEFGIKLTFLCFLLFMYKAVFLVIAEKSLIWCLIEVCLKPLYKVSWKFNEWSNVTGVMV